MSASLEMQKVRKRFGNVDAVDGVDLTVAAGSFVVLLGPSGCGKTTLLRLIAGFEVPDGGHISVGGTPVATDAAWVPPERRRVGMVFQQLALFPHLSVARNIGYGLRGSPRAVRRRRVDELLELVGLGGYGARMPHELSGGQAQRVALARALAPSPAVVLLDEPFSSLDVHLRADVRREVRRILRDASATAVLVTHDQHEALSLGDQVAVMLQGRIEQVGTPDDVYTWPRSSAVASFLGDANLVRARVVAGLATTPVGRVSVDAPDGEAVVVLRPEDLDLAEHPDGHLVVVAVEYFGYDQMVNVRLADGAMVRVRLHAHRRLPVGVRVRCEVVTRRVPAFPV